MKNPLIVFIAGFLLIATGFALLLKGFPMEDDHDLFMGSEIEKLEVTPLEEPPEHI